MASKIQKNVIDRDLPLLKRTPLLKVRDDRGHTRSRSVANKPSFHSSPSKQTSAEKRREESRGFDYERKTDEYVLMKLKYCQAYSTSTVFE